MEPVIAWMVLDPNALTGKGGESPGVACDFLLSFRELQSRLRFWSLDLANLHARTACMLLHACVLRRVAPRPRIQNSTTQALHNQRAPKWQNIPAKASFHRLLAISTSNATTQKVVATPNLQKS